MLTKVFLVHMVALVGKKKKQTEKATQASPQPPFFQSTVIFMKNYASIPTDCFCGYKKGFACEILSTCCNKAKKD